MVKNSSIFIIVLGLLFSSGCGTEKAADEQKSSTFISGSYKLQGEKGRIGILADGFKVGVPNKYMWFFWGTKEELSRTPFKVEAIDLKTGEKHPVLLKDIGTPNKTVVWEYSTIGGPNSGADAHSPSGMEFPTSGKWKLNAYLGEEFFGSIIINVH
ncbi:hypothetical protein [Paenibacillus eucommiae]|uniref:DUF4871 domain-containing protein n=1 Tax=Paenibacillus eucommiae TaxID=1355755 RepID=A0ABS4JCW9_9BACL|nr:hypothetical protein [Paenibacillus eucommiae]MBP1996926.1 hypothetical protein [Paenibacillus eucommiae]